VVKRTGANLINTVDSVKATMARIKETWPGTVEVSFTQDKSKRSGTCCTSCRTA
jgi:multidrug efflux pump